MISDILHEPCLNFMNLERFFLLKDGYVIQFMRKNNGLNLKFLRQNDAILWYRKKLGSNLKI